jgi:hypothetical protein
VTEAPSNQTSEISFIVFDTENYQQWSKGAQANFVYSAEKQGKFNFTFTTEKAGAYHFVFDNRASLYKKYVAFAIAYNEVITNRVPDPRANYASWALIVAGGLIFLYGLLRKPPIPWG